ncbi:putative CCR4-associated factor 1 8 [Arabidopsis thaliana]
MSLIEDCLRSYRFIAIDTEFPSTLRETTQHATDEERYMDMSFSVDRTKLIQLGLTLFDINGRIGGTWEINFSDFGVDDARNEKSIEFLRRNGLDLRKIREEGIRIEGFFSEMFWMLKKTRRNITWVTFHGSYDIAYLLKGFTGEALPVTSERFSKAVARVLGSVYDLKVMETLAHEFGLNRVGTAHHAGSNNELTAMVFAKVLSPFPLFLRFGSLELRTIESEAIV